MDDIYKKQIIFLTNAIVILYEKTMTGEITVEQHQQLVKFLEDSLVFTKEIEKNL